MIQTFGPYGIVANGVLSLTVRTDAQWVYVYNDSPLSLLVSFADAQPAATDSFTGAWNFAVRPHSDPVIPVQTSGVSALERDTNGIARFNGKVWILPRDPGGLAPSGTIATRAEMFVTVGGPYDAPPVPSSTQRETGLASQPRIIAVPMSGGQLQNGSWNQASFGSVTVAASVFANPLANAYTLPIYVYYAFMRSELQTPEFLVSKIILQWNALANDGVTVLANGNILQWQMQAVSNSTSNTIYAPDFLYNPVWPGVVLAGLPSGTKTVTVYFVHQSGSNVTIDWATSVGFDPTNQNAPGSTGNNTLLTGVASGLY